MFGLLSNSADGSDCEIGPNGPVCAACVPGSKCPGGNCLIDAEDNPVCVPDDEVITEPQLSTLFGDQTPIIVGGFDVERIATRALADSSSTLLLLIDL